MRTDDEIEALYRSRAFEGDALERLRRAFVKDREHAQTEDAECQAWAQETIAFCDRRIALIDKVLAERQRG